MKSSGTLTVIKKKLLTKLSPGMWHQVIW